MLTNGDFEIAIDSTLGGGWIPQQENHALEQVIDATSPSGYQHLKVSHNAGGLKYDLTKSIKSTGVKVEIFHWSKSSGHSKHLNIKSQIVIEHDGKKDYIMCSWGCIVPNDGWREFSKTCQLPLVKNVKSIYLMILPLNNPEKATLYHDKIQLSVFKRDRERWSQESEIRIREFRTTPVTLSPQDGAVDHVEIKMTRNKFPFGATMRKELFDDEEMRNQWPELFNFGVAANTDTKFTKCFILNPINFY